MMNDTDSEDMNQTVHDPFTEEEYFEMHEACMHGIHEYIEQNPLAVMEESFHEELFDNVLQLLLATLGDDDSLTDETESNLEDVVHQAMHDFFDNVYPPRSHPTSEVLHPQTTEDKQRIHQQLAYLQSVPQHPQKSPEWLAQRTNLITASDLHKVFGSPSVVNQLIYDKCKAFVRAPEENNRKEEEEEEEEKEEGEGKEEGNNGEDNDDDYVDQRRKSRLLAATDTMDVDEPQPESSMLNTSSSLHWGQKYEQVSVKLYEQKYGTRVEEFGCIVHPHISRFSFLGASPDGINADPSNDRFGRMLEIKNVVSRTITGIPKREYWVQMQMQMEVCNLDECDFLETKFSEYDSFEAFCNDVCPSEHHHNAFLASNGLPKGVLLGFVSVPTQTVVYKCMPLDITAFPVMETTIAAAIQEHSSEVLVYATMTFWRLEQFSCVLVPRNRQWFEHGSQAMVDTWATILKERAEGFDHRQAAKRVRTDAACQETPSSKCLLTLKKLE